MAKTTHDLPSADALMFAIEGLRPSFAKILAKYE